METHQQYFHRRHVEESVAAESAADHRARKAHLELAARYAQLAASLAEAEERLNGSGRIVVRASGTEPLIRIMAEGDDASLVNQVVKEIAGVVKQVAA